MVWGNVVAKQLSVFSVFSKKLLALIEKELLSELIYEEQTGSSQGLF